MSSEVVRDELLRIREVNEGALTAKAVVQAARDRENPLHGRFEWDDAKAGEKYREDQARELIRSVRVEFVDGRGDPQQVRVFHSVQRPSMSRPVYDTIENIARDEIGTAALLRQMEMEWRAMKRRYGHLEAFTKILQRETDARSAEDRQEELAG